MENRFGGKKGVNYNKFEVPTKQRKSNMLFTQYLHILLHLQAIFEVIFICTFKNPMTENLTNLEENLFKHSVHGVCFFQVWGGQCMKYQ